MQATILAVRKLAIVVLVFLALIPLANAIITRPFVKFTLIGDSPGVYELVEVGPPWSNPTYMGAHKGFGTECSGALCDRRYIDKKVFDFDLVDDSGNPLAVMALDGVVFASTLKDQETFSGKTAFAWGDAVITPVSQGFQVGGGEYVVLLEAWNKKNGKLALISKSQASDTNVLLARFDVKVDKILEGELTVYYDTVLVDEVRKGTEYSLQVADWGMLEVSTGYEVLIYSMKGKWSHIKERQVSIGDKVKAVSGDTQTLYYGWGHSWYDKEEAKHKRVFWGYTVEEDGNNGDGEEGKGSASIVISGSKGSREDLNEFAFDLIGSTGENDGEQGDSSVPVLVEELVLGGVSGYTREVAGPVLEEVFIGYSPETVGGLEAEELGAVGAAFYGISRDTLWLIGVIAAYVLLAAIATFYLGRRIYS